MELRHPAKNYYFGISTGYVIKQLVHAFSCTFLHRVMDALDVRTLSMNQLLNNP